MRKKAPDTIPDLSRKTPDRIIMERDYRLLTPLYGGGVAAGEVDKATPIHGTGVRGQLRFWWRATQAGRFNTVAEMKAAEDALWGSTKAGSAVTAAIIKAQIGRALTARNNKGELVNVGDPESPYGYVAFPLRQSSGNVYENATLTLRLSFPADAAEEVRAVIWAWDTFGGVGARTRRGFGALSCEAVRKHQGSAPFDTNQWRWEYDRQRVKVKLMGDVRFFVEEGLGPADVPKLSRDQNHYKMTQPQASELGAWTNLTDALKNFRQLSRKKYGRSSWPEPDAIRFLTRQPNPLPPDRQPIYSPRIDKFPRARFGLPIIVEFKNGAADATVTSKDPRKTTLVLAGHTRLASPLILRPLAVSGKQCVGLALILQGNEIPPNQLELQEMSGAKIATVDADLTSKDAAQITALHAPDVRITTDVLQSFLDSLS